MGREIKAWIFLQPLCNRNGNRNENLIHEIVSLTLQLIVQEKKPLKG